MYVRGTTVAEWQAVLDHVRRRCEPLTFTIDGQPAELPPRVDEVFGIRDRAEIEFDFPPEAVTGPEHLGAVLGFVRQLGEVTDKPVVLTPENMFQAPIFRFDPATQELTYVPPADGPGG